MTGSPDFDKILDTNEVVLWSGRPNAVPFYLSGVPFLIFGILWGCFDYFGFIRHMTSREAGFAIPFFALHLFPLWLGVGNMFRLVFVFRNTEYAITNRRLLIRGGFWGISFKSVDYDRIQETDVSVGPIEKMLDVGTIKFFSGAQTSRGANIYDRFIGISDPYEVYKKIKQTTVDVKTDWNYPNANRPTDNPGYSTKYTGPGK
jgi:membrane protein YdbS with pleckstrin-like domain